MTANNSGRYWLCVNAISLVITRRQRKSQGPMRTRTIDGTWFPVSKKKWASYRKGNKASVFDIPGNVMEDILLQQKEYRQSMRRLEKDTSP